jgi:Holliday junction resolvasome RuvABC endonuclease subunit
MKKKIKVLGIDPSLNGTALVVLSAGPRPDQFKMVDAVVFSDNKAAQKKKYVRPLDISTYDAEQTQLDRAHLVACTIYDLWHKHPSIEYCGIEGYAYGMRQKSRAVYQLGEVIGHIKQTVYEIGFPFQVIPPTKVKQFVTGNAHANKASMLMGVSKHYGIDFEDWLINTTVTPGFDLADAYAVARIIAVKALALRDIISVRLDIRACEMKALTTAPKDSISIMESMFTRLSRKRTWVKLQEEK